MLLMNKMEVVPAMSATVAVACARSSTNEKGVDVTVGSDSSRCVRGAVAVAVH